MRDVIIVRGSDFREALSNREKNCVAHQMDQWVTHAANDRLSRAGCPSVRQICNHVSPISSVFTRRADGCGAVERTKKRPLNVGDASDASDAGRRCAIQKRMHEETRRAELGHNKRGRGQLLSLTRAHQHQKPHLPIARILRRGSRSSEMKRAKSV